MDYRHNVLLVVLGIQLLLMPAYRSTDFEVHRNWLAITYSLPVSKWYYEDTSEWTLDYPPLFAWFEWLLAQVARLVDPLMLQLPNLEYASPATVLFQRLSVSVSGLLLAGAALWAARRPPSPQPQRAPRGDGGGHGSWGGGGGADAVLTVLIVGNAGMILVDNIHFQYNGMLLGILLWSILGVEEGRPLQAGALFAVLLNMKHLFAYAAPLYFVQLLRGYCMDLAADGSAPGASAGAAALAAGPNDGGAPQRRSSARKLAPGSGADGAPKALQRFLGRLALLGGLVVAVFAASFGPFVAWGQMPQLLRRMFPFGRGLCHAYWAANFWALYSFADKCLAAGLAGAGLISKPLAANMAGGIVGLSRFSVLPQVSPAATMAAVLLALAPCLAATWRAPSPGRFAAGVAYSNLCGFVFGWHVHEKALLMATLPLALSAARDPRDGARYLVLSTAAHVGLFPLLHQPAELPIRWLLVMLYALVAWSGLAALHAPAAGRGVETAGSSGWPLPLPVRAYLWGFVPLELYCALGHEALLVGRLPFVPLMLTSVYCAVGVAGVWASMAGAYVGELLRAGSSGGSASTTSEAAVPSKAKAQ